MGHPPGARPGITRTRRERRRKWGHGDAAPLIIDQAERTDQAAGPPAGEPSVSRVCRAGRAFRADGRNDERERSRHGQFPSVRILSDHERDDNGVARTEPAARA
jgi:hypothetical protein